MTFFMKNHKTIELFRSRTTYIFSLAYVPQNRSIFFYCIGPTSSWWLFYANRKPTPRGVMCADACGPSKVNWLCGQSRNWVIHKLHSSSNNRDNDTRSAGKFVVIRLQMIGKETLNKYIHEKASAVLMFYSRRIGNTAPFPQYTHDARLFPHKFTTFL